MRCVLVGAGVVGAAQARHLALNGHTVVAVDRDVARVSELGKSGLDARTELPELCHGDVVMLSLPTPEIGGAYDLGELLAATRNLGLMLRGLRGAVTVAQRSTVTPGTCESAVIPLLEEMSGLTSGVELHVAANPEFLRAAHADHDVAHPTVTVVGSRSAQARSVLRELYATAGGEIVETEDATTAELIKCAHNAFNATKVSFWNEIWMLGTRLGVDMDVVSDAVATSSEASVNPQYGIRGGRPYGGACLPKDVRALVGFLESVGSPATVLGAVEAVNTLMAVWSPSDSRVPPTRVSLPPRVWVPSLGAIDSVDAYDADFVPGHTRVSGHAVAVHLDAFPASAHGT